MKNQAGIIFSVLLLILSPPCFAQLLEGGLGYHRMTQQGTIIYSTSPGWNNSKDVNTIYHCAGLQIAWSVPVYKFNERSAFSFMTGVTALVSHKEDDDFFFGDIALGSQFPAYALFRLGAGSTRDAKSDYGLGIGAGGILMTFTTRHEDGTMITPSIIFEARFHGFGLRYEYLTKVYRTYYNTYTGTIPRLETRFFQLYFTKVIGKK
jgi:hypothetical protein